MIIGVPKEIKNQEKRVAITPAGVLTLKKNNHKVLIETKAGRGREADSRTRTTNKLEPL